jgi:hypothetical protein
MSELDKLRVPGGVEPAVEDSGFAGLPVGFLHVAAAEALPPHHGDPSTRHGIRGSPCGVEPAGSGPLAPAGRQASWDQSFNSPFDRRAVSVPRRMISASVLRRAAAAAGVALTLSLVAAVGACTGRTGPDAGKPGGGAVTELAVEAAAGPVVGTSFAEARRTGRGRLAFFYVPADGFAGRGEAGEPTGVTAELLRDFAHHVAATHGIALEVAWKEEPTWSDFYRHIRDSEGGVLGVGNVTITEARRSELDFSPPYLHNVAVLVTHELVPELRSMEEIGDAFRGLTALPFPGTLHETRLKAIRDRHLPGLPMRAVASNDEIVALLASEPGHFAYLDVYNFHRAREAGRPLRRHAVGDDASESFGVILPRGSEWTPVLEAFFRAEGGYVRSARYREHMRRHLGEEVAALLGG